MPDALEQWTEYLRAVGSSAATIKIRTQTIAAIQREAAVADPLSIRRAHVVHYFARPLSAWSRLTYWNSVAAWSRFLREFNLDPDSDLTAGIPRPRKPSPVARPITDETVEALLAAQMTPRARAYVRLALFAALRVHEIAQLCGEDFDWTAGWLMVTGKGGDTSPVPIHPEVRKLADVMPEFGLWFPSPYDPSRPVDPQAVSRTISAALVSVGSTASPHQLRDTAATRIQRKVKDIRLTQSMLRHRSIQSTQKYSGVSNDDLQRAVLALDWEQAAAGGGNVVRLWPAS